MHMMAVVTSSSQASKKKQGRSHVTCVIWLVLSKDDNKNQTDRKWDRRQVETSFLFQRFGVACDWRVTQDI